MNRQQSLWLLLIFRGIPFSFECHAYDLFVDFQFPKKLTKAKNIFTISNYNKHYLMQKFGCPSSKIIVKRVAFNKGCCDTLEHINREKNVIVSVCRLHKIKGLIYAIKAIHLLLKEQTHLEYLIIGDGPDKKEIIDYIEKWNLADSIKLIGAVSNEEALKFIKRSTISLLPSILADNGDRDGSPTALIESMYLKTPVISSKISGIPELIDNNVNGFLTNEKDIYDIAKKIKILLNDENLRQQFGERGRRKVLEEFSIPVNMEKMIASFPKKNHQVSI